MHFKQKKIINLKKKNIHCSLNLFNLLTYIILIFIFKLHSIFKNINILLYQKLYDLKQNIKSKRQ